MDGKPGERMEQETLEAAVAKACDYIFGRGIARDDRKGAEILLQYAHTDNAEVHGLLGMLYYNGFGVERDLDKALEHMLAAIENGDEISLCTAGYLLAGYEDGRPGNYPEAVRYLSRAADKGEIRALVYLAMVYSDPDYAGLDRKKSRDYLERAEQRIAESEAAGEEPIMIGDTHRCMANVYYELDEDADNRQRAFDHYCMAFSAGETQLAYDIGWMYFEEDCSGPYFTWSADELMQRMKEQEEESDEPFLAVLLGDICFEGLRWPENKREAAHWYRKAWDKGDYDSGRQLAECYFDTGQAEEYFGILQELHEEGDYEATYRLGECYESGTGVEKDPVRGKQLKDEADLAFAAAEEAAEMLDAAAEAYD